MKQDQRQDEIVPVLAFGNRENHHLHIGRRKLKSIFAMFLGFCFWQLLRLVLPELETHPLFIYIYAMIEIRESSKKTKENGKNRSNTSWINGKNISGRSRPGSFLCCGS